MSGDAAKRGDAIAAQAREGGVELAQDAELTALLSRVAQAEEIPDGLVSALSEVLTFLYALDGEQGTD